MAKKQNDVKLGDALKELLEVYRLDAKLDDVKVESAWSEIVGTMINKHTTSIKMTNGTLIVKLDHAAIRSELSYSKSTIIRNLNAHVGREVVKELILS